MKIDVQPGRYVAAVSGGIDSMVLLDMLRGIAGVELIVAHFDHGIRPDSGEDRRLVQEAAARYGLPFTYGEGSLGVGASEDEARKARYAFLAQVQREWQAEAIITAHHEDDLLETALLNILRGTGRKGLTSLANRPGIVRPLLHVSKAQIRSYAERHGIVWREDSTNTDDRYLRNYIRLHVLPRFDSTSRDKLLNIIGHAQTTNQELDTQLIGLIEAQSASHALDRAAFLQLPHGVAKELLASWLRSENIRDFDAKTLERVVIAAKTQRPGAIVDVTGGASLQVTRRTLALTRAER